MFKNKRFKLRAMLLIALMTGLTLISTRVRADSGFCGGGPVTLPFTDVAGNIFFCEIAAAYFSGLTNGTSASAFSPGMPVPREQMAAFTTRTLDQSLRRGSRTAALDQWWATQSQRAVALTTVGQEPFQVKSDGADLWVTSFFTGTVSRVRATDGKLLDIWTGATNAHGVLVALGRVFVTSWTQPGSLYMIDPTQPAGAMTLLTNTLHDFPTSITFDGRRIWIACNGSVGSPSSVSIVTLNPTTVVNVTAGFITVNGILNDGTSIWTTDIGDQTLKRLDSNGAILQTVGVGVASFFPGFDGTNIWVPNANSSSVTIVRASGSLGGAVLATLTGNGLNSPRTAAFDGERILVTNAIGNSVSMWHAASLAPIGSSVVGASPFGACSDGINFWIALAGDNALARF